MAFAGAPNVFHVKTDGNDSRDGKNWGNDPSGALKTVAKAVEKAAANSGFALILIAPGRYVGADARAVVNVPHVRFQGAGTGTVLEEDSQLALMEVRANHIEFADLTLVNSSTVANGSAILNPNLSGNPPQPAQLQGLRISRCYVKGKRAVSLFKVRDILVEESMLEGDTHALAFGNGVDAAAELYSCIAFNSDFRAVNSAPSASQAVLVVGGELTATNSNFTTTGSSSGTGTYDGIRADFGGQIALANCETSVTKGSSTSPSVGIRLAGATARMNLVACTVFVRQGKPGESFSIYPNEALRMKADACLTEPAW